jgi:hypothetical protein
MALKTSDIQIVNSDQAGRFLLIAKVDEDSLSDRRAAFHPSAAAAREAITEVPAGWWPDCLIDLDAPIDVAVRDAAAADGSLSDPYPFDADHVIFA